MPSPLSSARVSALAASLLAVAALTPCPAAAQFGTNLLVNGNAEAGLGSRTGNEVLPVPGWTTTGNFTVVQYAAGGGFPGPTSPGPVDRGANFFAGGPGAASSSATQRLDFTTFEGLLAQIAAGTVRFSLGGFFGGFTSQDDAASLTARFLDAGGLVVGSATAGPVFAADRRGITGMLERSTMALVPTSARSVEFTLAMAHREGNYNDAYADNLTFVLSRSVETTVPEPGTWALVGTGLVGVLGAARRRQVGGTTPNRVS